MAPRFVIAAGNVCAKGLSGLLSRSALFERLFLAMGRLVRNDSLPERFYRRTCRFLAERLKAQGRHVRAILVERIPLVMDVTHFTTIGPFFLGRAYEPLVTKLIVECLRPGDAFIDVGSNVGYFAILAAKRVGPTGMVIAIEPNPVVADVLRVNIARNGVAGWVKVEETALADSEGQSVPLYVSQRPDNNGLSSLVASDHAIQLGNLSPDKIVHVATTTLDSVLARHGATDVRMIKIDVEGAETMVIRGMRHLLHDRPPNRIICEGSEIGEVDEILTSVGYRVEALEAHDSGWGNRLFSLHSTETYD